MELEYTTFFEEDVTNLCQGGGVIPIAKHPDGEVRILLGRERFVSSWKGSCRWSGFEGGRKTAESVETTVCREFMEESLGLVLSREETERLVCTRGYWRRIVLNVSSDRRTERYHCTYVLVVDWDQDLSSRFDRTRLHLEYLERLVMEWTHMRSIMGTRMDTVCLPCSPEETAGDGGEGGQDGEETVLAAGDAQVVVKDLACEWTDLKEKLERALALAHPDAVRVKKGGDGELDSVEIKQDFIEKDAVRWWKASDLRVVLENKGFIENEKFRPYFLPVLQILVNELARDEP